MIRKILISCLLLAHFSAWANVDWDLYFKKKPPHVPTDYEKLIKKNIVLATKRLEFEDFPGAYNPSILQLEEGYVLTFRYSPDEYHHHWLSYIGIVLLNQDLEPISKPQLLNTRPKISKTPSQAEDARIFTYRGRLFLIYNDNVEITAPSLNQRRDLFIAELFYENGHFDLSPGLKLTYAEKSHLSWWEKNWVPFEYQGTLLITYMICPHEVIYPNLLSGACYKLYETGVPLGWKWGKIRGSTPPVLCDGEYLAFFHSGTPNSSIYSEGYEIWHYYMGAYTFSAEPPFNVTRMSPFPIVGPGFYTKNPHRFKRVIFPGGFVVNDSVIHMAYGKDDCEIWIATIDKNALKKSLLPVDNLNYDKLNVE